MTLLWVGLGVAVALGSLAAFAWGLGYLIRSVGHLAMSVGTLLPPAQAFVAEMAALRELPTPAGPLPVDLGPTRHTWPPRRDRGVAPGPVDLTSETSATLPDAHPGDRDWFDAESLAALAMANRPRSERQSAPPPGAPIEGEPPR